MPLHTTSYVLSGPYLGIQISYIVPWAKSVALRQQHAERVQALCEIANILQDLVPHGLGPAILRKFIPETAPSHRGHQEVLGN